MNSEQHRFSAVTRPPCAGGSRLLLLAATLCSLPAPEIAPSVTPPAPTLAWRLDRSAGEFDRNRLDLHLPLALNLFTLPPLGALSRRG